MWNYSEALATGLFKLAHPGVGGKIIFNVNIPGTLNALLQKFG